MTARWTAIAACCLLVASSPALAKKGKAREGVFTSPLGDYTVAVPNLAFGARTDQNFDDHGGALSFHSDLGEVYEILSDEMTPEVLAKIYDPSVTSDALRSYLENYVVPNVLGKGAPRTELVYKESVAIGDKPAAFGLVNMPEGSVLEDGRTHKRLDDRRGILVLARGKFIYTIIVGGATNVLGPDTATTPVEEMAAGFRKRVEAFYGTMTFTTPREN